MNRLIQALIEGNQSQALQEAESMLKNGVSREKIITNGIEKAMQQLDEKCTVEQFNLLEIMLAGRASMSVMKLLYPNQENNNNNKEKIILASLEGDIHDIGKNIVKVILIAKGYYVIDCGKDCPLQQLISKIVEEKPLAVGISGLITSVIPQVRKIKPQLHLKKVTNTKIIAGGATLKQSSAEYLNVDYLGQTAFDCLHFINQIQESKHEQS